MLLGTILAAIQNFLFFVLHVTGPGSFPQPLSEKEEKKYLVEMKQGDNVFLVGFKDLLIGLKLMEQMHEIPKISDKWWSQIATLYGWDLQALELEDKQ